MSWVPPPRSRRGRRGTDQPVRFSDSVGVVMRSLGMSSSGEVLARLFSQWDDMVGPSMAAHVRPSRVEDDSLVVMVDHPAWATQIRLLAPELLLKIGELVGAGAPTRLEVRVQR
jgi:hypothetical protein